MEILELMLILFIIVTNFVLIYYYDSNQVDKTHCKVYNCDA
jgi:hypothetical protein